MQKETVGTSGNILVTAGPGTGKSETLLWCASKVKRPLLLVFTNKAADRVGGLTIHSFCHSLIGGAIWSRDRSLGVLKRICRDMKLRNPSEVAQQELLSISWRKCLGLKAPLSPVAVEYEKRKGSASDFGDLLLRGLDYVTKHDVRARYGGVFVDELQDIDPIQYEIIKRVTGDLIVAIGDPYQSIYTWRDAFSTVFEAFKKDFNPTCRDLLYDHRHGKEIVDVLEWFWKRGLIPAGPPARVEVIMCTGSGSEMLFVSRLAKELGECDVLCRTWRPLLDLNAFGLGGTFQFNRDQEDLLSDEYFLTEDSHNRFWSIHASKGRTFENDIVMGASEGQWPVPWCSRLEEEERLFYVAISRAHRGLFITHQGSASTFFFRNSDRNGNIPCRVRSFYEEESGALEEMRHAKRD